MKFTLLFLSLSMLAYSADIAMPARGLCAHRGAMSTHPENTIPAFEEAIRLGAQMIEFDVQLTKDGALVLMQVALLLLVGPSLGANLIASEVESGGWQLLRAAPFSPVRILSGKVMSAVWTMLLVLLATLPGYAVMSYIQPAMSGQVSNVSISLLVAVALVVSISACISAFAKSTAIATATSYGVLLTLFAGTLLIWLARGKPFGPLFVERMLMLNPAAAALSEMKTAGFEQYNLTPTSWWVGGAISLACLIVLAGRIWRMTRPD